MVNNALTFGSALIIIGLFGYFYYPAHSPTALIPAGFGLGIILSAMLARKEEMRKHGMHLAAFLGLLGALGGWAMVIKGLASGGGDAANNADTDADGRVLMQSLMAAICTIFVLLCIKSFTAARKSQDAGTETPEGAVPEEEAQSVETVEDSEEEDDDED